MTHKLASQAVETSLQKVVRRRKYKAFLITSTAMYALVFMFWSMSVEGFVSQSKIRLAIQYQDRIPTAELTDHVARQWEQQLSDTELDQQIEALADTIELKDPVMLGKNFDRVRKSLDYEIVRDRDVGHVDIYLTYLGTGSEAELELVNRLSGNIATRFATIGAGIEKDASHWVQQELELQDSQQEKLERVQWLVSQLDTDITEVRSVADEFTEIDTGLIARLPVAHSDNSLDSRKPWSEIDHDGIQPRISLLRQKLNALKEKQAQLVATPPRDSSADWIDIEIEEVRRQLNELGSRQNTGARNRGSLPVFHNVSHRSQLDAMARIKNVIDSIDVISLKSTVAQLEQDFVSQKQLISQQRLASDSGSKGLVFPVLVKNVTQARAKPLGGLPSATTVMGFFLLSVLAGSVVAWGYSPLKEDRGFVSSEEIEKKLKLPVISQLIRKSGDNEEDLPLCNLVMEMARLALLVILLIVVFGLVFDPSVRETFTENPLYGIARIMWNLLGK